MSSKKTQAVEVGIMCRDSQGAPDVTFAMVDCTAAEREHGHHHEVAMATARERGYTPVLAFDKGDPAWQTLVAPARFYKGFFAKAFHQCQDAFVSDRACSGADLVDTVGQLFNEALNDPAGPSHFYIAITSDGYWNEIDGWVENASDATHFLGAEELKKLHGTNLHVLEIAMRLPMRELDAQRFPSVADLWATIDDVLERASKYGYTLSGATAREAILEELQMAGAPIDESLVPFMVETLLYESAQRQRPPAERA